MSWRSHGGGTERSGTEQPCAAATAKRAAPAMRKPRPRYRLLLKSSRDNIITFELLNKILQLTTDIITLAFLTALEHRHDYQQVHDYHIITQVQRCIFELYSIAFVAELLELLTNEIHIGGCGILTRWGKSMDYLRYRSEPLFMVVFKQNESRPPAKFFLTKYTEAIALPNLS